MSLLLVIMYSTFAGEAACKRQLKQFAAAILSARIGVGGDGHGVS